MRNLQSLAIRLTHHWANHCSHRDRWRFIGTLSVLSCRIIESAESYDTLDTLAYRVRVDSAASAADVKAALHAFFTLGGCNHTYDCCGCPTRYASDVRHLRRKEWLVTSVGYRNL